MLAPVKGKSKIICFGRSLAINLGTCLMEEKKKQNKNRLRAEIGNVLKNLLAFKQFLLLSKQVIESGIEINLAVKRYAIESNRIQWK